MQHVNDKKTSCLSNLFTRQAFLIRFAKGVLFSNGRYTKGPPFCQGRYVKIVSAKNGI